MRIINTITFRYLKLSAALAVLGCSRVAHSQELRLSYITEWQNDLGAKSAWVNLLQSEGTFVVRPGISAEIGTISTCKTNREQLLSNLTTYSNIEEINIPLALSRLGIRIEKDKFHIFAGVGNVNDYFFVTPVTSLFTNSSCGIFPTISANFGIANFPDASVGVEGQYETGGFKANCAVYNGKASHHYLGKEGVFRLCPATDGIFNINAVNYRKNGNNYNLGFGVHHSGIGSDETTAQEFPATRYAKKKNTEIFYWLYAEQMIAKSLAFIVQYSQCPGISDGCRDFYGAGVAYDTDKYSLGLYSCYGDFSDNAEWASELTFIYRISTCISIQPALHYICNSASRGAVGLLRVCFTL